MRNSFCLFIMLDSSQQPLQQVGGLLQCASRKCRVSHWCRVCGKFQPVTAPSRFGGTVTETPPIGKSMVRKWHIDSWWSWLEQFSAFCTDITCTCSKYRYNTHCILDTPSSGSVLNSFEMLQHIWSVYKLTRPFCCCVR